MIHSYIESSIQYTTHHNFQSALQQLLAHSLFGNNSWMFCWIWFLCFHPEIQFDHHRFRSVRFAASGFILCFYLMQRKIIGIPWMQLIWIYFSNYTYIWPSADIALLWQRTELKRTTNFYELYFPLDNNNKCGILKIWHRSLAVIFMFYTLFLWNNNPILNLIACSHHTSTKERRLLIWNQIRYFILLIFELNKNVW